MCFVLKYSFSKGKPAFLFKLFETLNTFLLLCKILASIKSICLKSTQINLYSNYWRPTIYEVFYEEIFTITELTFNFYVVLSFVLFNRGIVHVHRVFCLSVCGRTLVPRTRVPWTQSVCSKESMRSTASVYALTASRRTSPPLTRFPLFCTSCHITVWLFLHTVFKSSACGFAPLSLFY